MKDIWDRLNIHWVLDEKTGEYTHYKAEDGFKKSWFVLFTKWNSDVKLKQGATYDYEKALKVYREYEHSNFIVELKENFDDVNGANVIKSNNYKWSDIEIHNLAVSSINND